MRMQATYLINRVPGKHLGVAKSMEAVKKKINKDGRLLTRYEVIRTTAKGRSSRVGVYQNRPFGRRLVTVKVR
jgi:hypothetical protein